LINKAGSKMKPEDEVSAPLEAIDFDDAEEDCIACKL
jgi:hypothetical protein